MTPTLGRTVIYQLSQDDIETILAHRASEPSGQVKPFVGNTPQVGDKCAATVVQVFSPEMVNLQVLLDGNDSLWATSRHEGTEPGTWAWPVRKEEIPPGAANNPA